MQLEAARVGRVDGRLQRVEVGRQAVGAGLEVAVVESVAAAADLEDHVLEALVGRVLHDRVDVALAEGVIEAVDEDRAVVELAKSIRQRAQATSSADRDRHRQPKKTTRHERPRPEGGG